VAPYKESTYAQRNIQRPSNPFVQKREVVKRYTRQSQTLKVNNNTNGPMGVVFGLFILLTIITILVDASLCS